MALPARAPEPDLDPVLGELGLAAGELLVLDTAILLYLVEGRGPRREAAEIVLQAAREGSLRIAVSAIAWTELLTGPLARGEVPLADAYRRLLADSRAIRIAPVDVAIAEAAAELRAGRLGRRAGKAAPALADALHLGTALVLGARGFLTNDENLAALARTIARGPRVLILDELAAAWSL